MAGCLRCGASLTPVVDETALWQVRLNLNQNLLGKTIIVLKRHEEQVVRLSEQEWADLYGRIGRMTGRLQAAFNPDHSNYAFLENQDRHVHLHVRVAFLTNPSGLSDARLKELAELATEDAHAQLKLVADDLIAPFGRAARQRWPATSHSRLSASASPSF